VIICDLQILRSRKYACEEGGRTLAIINKNIDLAGEKKSSCHIFLIKSLLWELQLTYLKIKCRSNCVCRSTAFYKNNINIHLMRSSKTFSLTIFSGQRRNFAVENS